MAGEIEFDAPTGVTCYVQVRSATGTIWNGAAFEAYLTANIASYAVTATEQGTASGLYVATMPAAVAGTYNVLAKRRAGGSPAEADVTVATGTIEWTGTLVLTAPLAADMFFRRTMAEVEASAAGSALGVPSLYGMIQQAQESDTTTNAGKLTIFKTDGTTELGQKDIATSAAADPITGIS